MLEHLWVGEVEMREAALLVDWLPRPAASDYRLSRVLLLGTFVRILVTRGIAAILLALASL